MDEREVASRRLSRFSLISQVFFGACRTREKSEKRSLTGLGREHRTRAFRRDLERFRPALDGLRLNARGLENLSAMGKELSGVL